MKSLKHFTVMLLSILLYLPMAQAQTEQVKRQEIQGASAITQDVLIIIQQEKVRFTAQKTVAEMQLQVFDQSGQLVYDSGAVAGPELTWSLRQADGETVKSGLYAYTLSIKDAGAADARSRRGHFIVDRAKDRDGADKLWVTSRDSDGVGAELTVARDENVTIAGTSTNPERTVGRSSGGREVEAESQNRNDAIKTTSAVAATAGTAGKIAKFTSATDLGNSVITELNGNIGIGTASPSQRLHVHSAGAFSPLLLSTGSGSEGPAAFRIQADSGLFGYGRSFVIYDDVAQQYRMIINGNGNVGIGTPNATSKLEILAQDALNMIGYQPFLTLTDLNAGGARASIQNVNGGIVFLTHTGGSAMYIQNGTQNIGIGTATPQAKLDVVGTARASVLQITGGADFAENFEVNLEEANKDAGPAKIQAGMVVSIDPDSPGKLQLSAEAYDSHVAGIISGAGGIKPGMTMSQEGTAADGKYPVALSGRVYCWADATQGAIKPGDMLTTSALPGHAMKVTDKAKAQGAIIGKAMTGLKEGKGLVLVLVTLQ